MNLLSINPYVRFARVQKKPLRHNFIIGLDHRIFFCFYGEGEITVGDSSYAMTPNTFLFIRSGIPYKNTSKKDKMSLLAYNFDLFYQEKAMGVPVSYVSKRKYTPQMLVEQNLCQKIPDLPDVLYVSNFYKKEIFQEIIDEYNRKDIYYNERCSTLLKDALICAVRAECEENARKQNGKGYAILSYIREHFAEPITNATIAEHFSYHKNYINQILKHEFGQTVHQCLIHYRIKMSISFLQSGEYTVSEVSKQVGFSDIFYFSKCFKKITGKAPSFYLPK